MKSFGNSKCCFIYNIPSEGLKNNEDVIELKNSIIEFLNLSNNNHKLLAYIRYDESFLENEEILAFLESELEGIERVRLRKHVVQKEKFGIWGDKRTYAKLIKSLGVKIKPGLPIIYINKEAIL